MLDPDFLAAIGHPLRLRALVFLEREPASARDLAEHTGTSAGATAYHVRRLADAGLIEENGGRDDGAARLWRTRASGWATLQELLVESTGRRADS